MRIETYKSYNPKAKRTISPKELLKEGLTRINNTIKSLQDFRPKIIDDFLIAFKKSLSDEVKNYSLDTDRLNLTELSDGLIHINEDPDLQDLILKLLFKYLSLSAGTQPGLEEFEGVWVEALKGRMLVPYYRTKAFIDILGREEGIKFWKELVLYILEGAKEEEGESWPPIKETAESWINGAKSGENQGFDFTAVIYDDYKVLLKFDRCITHEALRHLEDQEVVYLSNCWVGDVANSLNKKSRRLRRSQTLHLGDFCDELYWNNTVHPDAEQPDLEFMQKLGKEDPTKLMAEYQNWK